MKMYDHSNYLKKKVDQDPRAIKEIFRSYDGSDEPINDRVFDDLLGISWKTREKLISPKKLQDRFGIEQFRYEGTPYSYIRKFLAVIKPKKDDFIYDLGSGYGRVCLYSSLTSNAQVVGIELVPERVFAANEAKKRFDIRNVSFIQNNVLDQDFSDGTIFFLFNPFFRETLEKVSSRLEEIAAKKIIRIATWGGASNDYLREQDWLDEIISLNLPKASMEVFESK